ncbi:MAG: putative LPLAT superfamily acyltransferase [Planctomycetota bacterium]|jgi:predicted LPLAT superfamily acyltransferase
MTDDTWLSQGERGSLFLIKLTYRLATLMGRPFMRIIVSMIALWYRLFDRKAVAASRAWLTRVHARPAGFWEIYRHLRVFAQVTLDRVFLLTGKTHKFAFTNTGLENLTKQVASGQGAMLLGAHVGSYEAMRAGGVMDDVPIRILGFFENARQINALMSDLNPEQSAEVIHLGKDPIGATIKAKASIDSGHLVAILADRVGLNDKVVTVDFMGEPAEFPTGVFIMASVMKCPVFLVFGLYSEPNRYDLYCESFAERIVLPRKDRQEHLQELVQRYASRVEFLARKAPHNWFNFFDFWKKG